MLAMLIALNYDGIYAFDPMFWTGVARVDPVVAWVVRPDDFAPHL